MLRSSGWALSLLLFLAAPAGAQLSKVETDRVRIVYVAPSETYLVPHAARTLLNADAFLRKLFDYKPTERVNALLVDFQDYGNAGATSVPRNSVRVQIAPLSFAFETIMANERMNTIMNHELVHVVSMDQATPRDQMFRTIFGGKVLPLAEQPETIAYFFLTTPRVASPRWFHEGSAVFIDTWMAGGIGRAQSGYDEMVFRAMVRDDARFYDPLGLVAEGTKIDFQTEVNSYLYGARFITWLAYRYTPEQVVKWIARQPGSRAYYASHFRAVFGRSIEEAWAEWVAHEKTFQQANLAAIRKYPITPVTDVSPRSLGSVSRAHYDPSSRTIFAGVNYPGAVAHVAAISAETGEMRRLTDIKGPLIYQVASLAWDPKGRMLYYTTDNAAHRDLVSLDPATGQTRVLQKDARIGDLAFNRADHSLWGIRHLNGMATIVRMAPPYIEWTRAVTLPYGTVVYDLDVSADGTMVVASFGDISGSQDVRVLATTALLKGEVTPIATFDFPGGVPNGFTFSDDGRYLYGSAYLTGVSNIFRYEIATKKLDPVSNTDTGLFRPIPLGGNDLIVFRYTGEGFRPARMTATPLDDLAPITFFGERVVDRHPELKQWALGSPADIPYDTMPKQEGVYKLGGGLRTESFYPVVQGYKSSAAVGMRMNFSDPMQFNRLSVSALYSPDSDLPGVERVHLDAEYQRYDWKARVSWNPADFYDLFGPTQVSRKGESITVGHTRTLVFDEPRRVTLAFEGRLAADLDQLPEYQNVPVRVDRLASVTALLSSTNVRGSIGRVDDEKGQKWTVGTRVYYVNSMVFAKVQATHDIGAALPLGHSSLWVRSAAGFSPQAPDEPFANFFFGGFGNNYLDRGEEKRYREVESFPGAEINEIGGRNFVRSMLEWTLPPWRFSRVGTPGAYLSWLRPALFVSGLVTNLDQASIRRQAISAGGQIDLRFSVLSALDMTFSAGAAVRVGNGVAPAGELMASLRVLR
jgi:hypothetical protein